MLVSCVSRAQLSNYATFLTDSTMAPLSIAMTSIYMSTATAVFVTPLLSLLLMVYSITQIVVAPIAAGLLVNRLFPHLSTACYSSIFAATITFVAGYFFTGLVFPEASYLKALQRTMSCETLTTFLFTYVIFHGLYSSSGQYFPLQECRASSLLALALANKFFKDPLVAVHPAVFTVIMSLVGFSLVMLWSKKKE
ncbi:hypothetical protein Peur_003319 [Populus x canadensis]